MLDKLLDGVIDTVKLIPFLFLSFLLMELLEHNFIGKKKGSWVNKFSPLFCGLLGIFPQCGFAVMGANMYACGLISLGALLTIFLTTTDEALFVLIADGVSFKLILIIIGLKTLLGILLGVLIDFIHPDKMNNNSCDICQKEHCECESKGIVWSSLVHTIKTSLFIFIVNLGLNFILDEDKFMMFFGNKMIFLPIIVALVGLIPNCFSSVIITELYTSEVISFGSFMAGMLSTCGMGLLVLFKQNKKIKKNLLILGIIFFYACLWGIIIDLL